MHFYDFHVFRDNVSKLHFENNNYLYQVVVKGDSTEIRLWIMLSVKNEEKHEFERPPSPLW